MTNSVGLDGRGIALLLLTIAASAAVYSRTAVGPLQETLRAALALSDNQMALLQGPALALPVVLAAVPLGLVIDRYVRVRLLFMFAVLGVVGSGVTALAANFATLFAARCLIGLTATATLTTAYSLLSDLYAPRQRGRATMVVAMGQVAGGAAAFALGGQLLALLGPVQDGWRWAMLWLTGPLIPVTMLMLVIREPSRTGVGIENSSTRQAFVELWSYRAVILPLAAGLMMVGVADGAAFIWAAPTLSRRFALPPDRTGAIMATGLLVSGLLGAIVGGSLADICQRTGGPRRTISVLSGLAFVSVPAGLFAVMPNVEAESVLLVMFMTIGGVISVAATTLCTVVIPNELRGVCLAALFAAGAIIGIGLAPMTVSLLSGAIGGPGMIGKALVVVCVATSVLGATTFAFGSQHFPRTAVQ